MLYDDIRLPRLWGGNIVCSPTEAVNVIKALVGQNAAGDKSHNERTLLVLIKEKMIKEKRTPVTRSHFLELQNKKESAKSS